MFKKIILGFFISLPVLGQTLKDQVVLFDTDKIKTTGVIVANAHGIIGEYYENFGREDRKFLLWSISKTVSGLIVGRAIQEGILKLEENVRGQVTVRSLLEMSSGLSWDESYEEAPFKSNVVRMLYGPEAFDMGQYVLSIPAKHKPGHRFKYSSGDSNLLQWYLKKKMGPEYSVYPWKALFDPLDIRASFETDGQGVFVASSYVYMSLKDLLKVAQLILNKGNWGGVQLISEDYITSMTTQTKASSKRSRMRSDDLNYGFQIWLNGLSGNGKLPLKDLPPESIFMLGHHGQIVGIFPDEQIIILRSASDRGRLDKNKFFKEILAWAKKQKSL